MTVLAAAIAALFAAAATGTLVLLLARRSAAEKEFCFQLRLYRLEKNAARGAQERLRIMRQRTGIVYLDGLVAATGETGCRFEQGMQAAAKGLWDSALAEWTEAGRNAAGSEQVALRFLVGCCHFVSGRADKARQSLDGALTLARKHRDLACAASCLYVLGRLEKEGKKYEASRKHYEESARLWALLGDMEREAKALVDAAEVEEETGRGEQALELHRRALLVLEKFNDKRGAAQRYASAGRILEARGELDRARGAYEGSLHLARQCQDRLTEAAAQSSIAGILLKQGSVQRAQEAYERSLRLYRDTQQLSGQARTLLQLALCREQVGDTKATIDLYEQALRLGRRVGDRRLIARSLAGMAEAMAAHVEHERILAFLEEAVTLDRESRNEEDLARHLVSLGRAHLGQREADKAQAVLREALDLSRRRRDRETEIRAALELSRALRDLGRGEEALSLLESCQDGRMADGKDAARLHAELGLALLQQARPADAVPELKRAIEAGKGERGREHGRMLVSLGRALSGGGDQDAGMRAMEDGIRVLHECGAMSDEAWALRVLAEENQVRGKHELARQSLDRALVLARGAEDEVEEATCLVELGRLAGAGGNSAQARAFLEQAARVFGRAGRQTQAREILDELRRMPHGGVGVQLVDDSGNG